MSMAGELAFFEIGVADAAKGRAFYHGLLGWSFEPGPSGGFVITTPNVPGGMHGDDSEASPYVFFQVDDMNAALSLVRELGGEVEDADVEGDQDSIDRFGRFKLCKDNQGSNFGLHEPPPVG
jgi:predicted enzyme related to lactoylglutathione lyase